MRPEPVFIAAAGLLLALFTAPARADEASAVAALRQGGHVALMRHTDAPGGAGDPPGFRLDDCATQRNLSPKGRADAAAVGARLKRERIQFSRILSSPWCRCLETVRLMGFGEPQVEAAFSNAFVLADRSDALMRDAKALIAAWDRSGTLLIVTHGSNIQALTGIGLKEGEIAVVTPGELREVGRLNVPGG